MTAAIAAAWSIFAGLCILLGLIMGLFGMLTLAMKVADRAYSRYLQYKGIWPVVNEAVRKYSHEKRASAK
jgi:hypothetical protein